MASHNARLCWFHMRGALFGLNLQRFSCGWILWRQMWMKLLTPKSYQNHESFVKLIIVSHLAWSPGWFCVSGEVNGVSGEVSSVMLFSQTDLFHLASLFWSGNALFYHLPAIIISRFLLFHSQTHLSCRFFWMALCVSSKIAGMGRVGSTHVSPFPSVTFVFYLAIRSFPTLSLKVIRETS